VFDEVYNLFDFNPLKAELNPICHLLALLGAHHIFHASGLRVNPWKHVDVLQSSLNLCTGRPPAGVMIPDAV
jgi:hypothetical protein